MVTSPWIGNKKYLHLVNREKSFTQILTLLKCSSVEVLCPLFFALSFYSKLKKNIFQQNHLYENHFQQVTGSQSNPIQ